MRSQEYKDRFNKQRRERRGNDIEYRDRMRKYANERYHKNKCLTDHYHGMSKTRAWKAWHNMRSRVMCVSNKNYQKYKNYSIDPRWDKFLNFYADMGKCPEGMTLDRKDNNKGYCKDNCRWATPAQQAHNTCRTKLSDVKVIEMKKLLKDTPNYILAKKYGVSQQTICDIRYGRGWKEVGNV